MTKAIFEIDLSKEGSLIAAATRIHFLEITSHGGKEAADWVHDRYPEVIKSGKEEAIFGDAKVTLEAKGTYGEIFILTVESTE